MIVIVEGHPLSGKDTVAGIIAEGAKHGPWVMDRLSVEIEERCHGAYKLFTKKGGLLPAGAFEGAMDEPTSAFEGLTPRSAYDNFYRTWIENQMGDGAPGRWLLARVEYFTKLQKEQLPEEERMKSLVLSDAVSHESCVQIVEHFGADEVILVKVFRPGHFSKRLLVNLRGCREVSVENIGTLEELKTAVRVALPDLFETQAVA